MKTFNFDIDHIPDIRNEVNLCLGFFDGVHLGHKKIIESAKKEGYKLAVLTFDLSPSILIDKKSNHYLLTSNKQKEHILKEIGVDYLLILKFNHNVQALSSFDFISKVLCKFNIGSIFCGSDYHFGYKAEGDCELLKKYFHVNVIKDVSVKKMKISSSYIINEIQNGNIKEANKLLGRLYTIEGKVIKGFQNGHKINFPTANLKVSFNYAFPKNGVYFGFTKIKNKEYKCLINVGFHPTIQKLNKLLIEVYVIDFNENLYGRNLSISFFSRIRDEKKFENLTELKKQIEKDLFIAKNLDY